MGRQLLAAAAAQADVTVVAAWTGARSPRLGEPVPAWPALAYGRLGETDALPQVVIDFSRADAFRDVLDWCVRHRVPLVSGTTGLDPAQTTAREDAGQAIPLLWAANFSLGVAVLARAVALAAAALPAWDAEIIEAHHAGKRDAPSGTALSLGRALAQARAVPFEKSATYGRDPASPARRPGEIGFSTIRGGDIVGEHTVMLAGHCERIELVHRATDRAIFAHGALHAARWLRDRPPGLYGIDDCLD